MLNLRVSKIIALKKIYPLQDQYSALNYFEINPLFLSRKIKGLNEYPLPRPLLKCFAGYYNFPRYTFKEKRKPSNMRLIA